MKFLHAADLHLCKERAVEALASVEAIINIAKENLVDLVLLAGDTWDGPISNTDGASFPAFINAIKRLADVSPVAMIYGTPTHDTEGSLEVFKSIYTYRGISVLDPMKAYFLHAGGYVDDKPGSAIALLFGVPEPQKKWLLAGAGAVGKETADEAVREGLSALFLGLGGLRKQHEDLPCVVMYHGQVRGAISGTGFEASSGLAASREQLASVGADYLALGDIHEPQRIADLQAYYSGSTYNKDFGETHQAGVNLVTLAGPGEPIQIDRVDLPQPRRRHEKISFAEIDHVPIYDGTIEWLEISCTRAEADKIDVNRLTAQLLSEGTLPGSRVTLSVIPTETLRAGEIVEKRRLRDKVVVWAEASELEVPEGVLTKADQVEADCTGTGAGGAGTYIRLQRIHLRGAIGLWKKSRKDEVDLDLEALGPGVFALIGANGEGKTSLIENMHPWPCLFTRDGTLKDHFRLRDSFRDLYFVDERTGIKYRALLTINAAIASGKVEYFLYQDTGLGFQPVPGITGRKEGYLAAIETLFGSMELYLRTAFVSQRPSKAAPDLQDSSEGQRKALFRELAGLDYLESCKLAARSAGDTLEKEIDRKEYDAKTARDAMTREPEIQERIKTATSEAEVAGAKVGDVEAQGVTVKTELTAAREKLVELQTLRSDRDNTKKRIDQIEADTSAKETSVASLKASILGHSNAVKALAALDDLEARKRVLEAAKSEIVKRNADAAMAWSKACQEVDGRRNTARTALELARSDLSQAETREAVALKAISAPVKDHCPTCGQALPDAERAALQEARKQAEKDHADAMAALAQRRDALVPLQTALDAIVNPPAPKPEAFEGEKELADILGELDFSESRESLNATIKSAESAVHEIETVGKQITTNMAEVAELSKTFADLNSKIMDFGPVETQVRELEEKRERLVNEYTSAKEARAAAIATRETEERRLAEIKALSLGAASLFDEIEKATVDLAEWRFLEKACGPDGVQALELDALSPSVCQVANKLLSEAYGSRFSIEIKTTRIAGTGSKTKQVEDFSVNVYDSETGEDQEISTLSGGEVVWIKRALYDAFAVIRSRTSGTQFLTAFQDETDGALDPESRILYLRMLEAAHDASGRYQTILITHSTELQAMVTNRIVLAELGPRAEQAKEEKAA